METKVKLIEKELYEGTDGLLYLSLVYEYEREEGKYRIYYPKVITGITTDMLPFLNTNTARGNFIDYGGGFDYALGKTNINRDIPTLNGTQHIDESAYYLKTKLEEYPLEVTMDEIELKFGRKIKIVKSKN